MFAEQLPVRLVLADDRNSTFTGVIQMVHLSPEDDDGVTSVNGTDIYDHSGAGLFIVLVIAVYALSIVLLIASFIKKKQVRAWAESLGKIVRMRCPYWGYGSGWQCDFMPWERFTGPLWEESTELVDSFHKGTVVRSFAIHFVVLAELTVEQTVELVVILRRNDTHIMSL